MQSYPISYLIGNYHLDALEAADVGGFAGLPDDPNAEMEAAFGYGAQSDELAEREIDEMFVAEMERRDREAAELFGGGSDDDDPPPARPGLAALALYCDGDLISAIAKVDDARFDDGRWVGIDASNPDEPDLAHPTIPSFLLKTRVEKEKFLDAATAELLRRIDQPQRLAA